MFSRILLNNVKIGAGVAGLAQTNVDRRSIASIQGLASGVLLGTYPTYTIKYNSRGGTVVRDQIVAGNALTRSAANIPTKSGYVFASWSIVGESSPYVDTAMPFANLSLTANWTPAA